MVRCFLCGVMLLLPRLGIVQAEEQRETAKPSAVASFEETVRVLVYPVADLVTLPPNRAEVGGLRSQQDSSATESVTAGSKTLMSRIQEIQPATWENDGAIITFESNTLSLIVRQTSGVHQAIAKLLEADRKELDTQIVLEYRVVSTVGELPRLKKLLQGQRACLLNADQFDELWKAMLADRNGNTLFAPKVTVFQKRTAVVKFEAGDQEQLVLEARAAAVVDDVVEIRLSIGLEDSLGDRQVVQASRKIHPGETMLMATGANRKDGTPIYALVTPRIIHVEEEEKLLGVPK